jgi:phenylalanyl-tRNA synthetase alpha chain
MKMYIKPISKQALNHYLAIPDLTQGKESHAVKLLYENIRDYIERTHPESEVQVYRQNPIVSVADNYDALLIDNDNISRSSTYTHYVDKTHILRTHTSAHMPDILRELSQRHDWEDVIILLPGHAYRRDVSDKKHVNPIHMLDMWRIVKNSARKKVEKEDLLDVVKGIARVAAPGWKLRIIDSPHPYTRGGIEVNAVLGDRDIEILECGLIKDEILANAGMDPKEYSGWASGIGLDRLVMTLKGLPDVRYLRSTNPKIAVQMQDLEPYREVSHQPAITRDLSYSIPAGYVEEDIHEDIRQALGGDVEVLESVEVLQETPYKDLNDGARRKLGTTETQKNVLVRITLRHLERTLTNEQANELYKHIYARINQGSGGYLE